MKQSPQRTVQLVESIVVNSEVRHLVFETLGQPSFEFTPGQHLCLGAKLNEEQVERYYSIASAPNGGNRFELCAKASPEGGGFGQHLARMECGDQLQCKGPGGQFRLKEPVRDTVFVACGTGLAPLRAMLHHLISGDDRSGGAQLTMILGTRRPDWRYYYDEFSELAARSPNFRFWPTISRPAGEWQGRGGYAQAHLTEALDGRTSGVDVYLCGHSAMVKETRRSLEQTGFDIDSVVYEKYG